MIRVLSILSVALFISCINPQDGIIHNKKWRMVKETIVTEDKTGKRTEVKTKDFMMDYLNFENATRLTIESYGTAEPYSYKITDSILTFSRDSDKKPAWKYGIITSTKDSLVIKRTEIWGDNSALKITATLHFVPVPAR